jgi:hypothetical protein
VRGAVLCGVSPCNHHEHNCLNRHDGHHSLGGGETGRGQEDNTEQLRPKDFKTVELQN